MPLTKPNHRLRRDLKEAASLLKWAGVDLMQALKRSKAGQEAGARELIEIVTRFQAVEDLMVGYAEEVKAGGILRWKLE